MTKTIEEILELRPAAADLCLSAIALIESQAAEHNDDTPDEVAVEKTADD
ncbi:hypothetical protein GS597_02740 [Synechococcales cyanobacterium C]|uniref:Uncharacterized protein n=1 Tax=Petrachloros mirabilis ULC683 TaxID=2781853 RepID=A0A8K1ZWK8_9CYAN|nr:hypothetical protein [Petrachloros mirabilis]NCJ05446.1 hypothetical protein [Petrachloros mirabilis ULC683]